MHPVRIGISSTPIRHDGHALHSINRAFVDAVAGAGAVPVVLPVLDPELAPGSLEGLDALLLSGGGDVDPATYGEIAAPEVDQVDVGRDRFEVALVHEAIDRGMPVLGVCRGHQVLNVALGGRLIQHVPHLTEVSHQEKGRAGDLIHTVQVDPGSLVAAVLGGELVGVNTLHHQAVAEPGDGLLVVARSTEDGLMEAVEHVDRPVIGVQWHPELLLHHPEHRRLFRWLVDEGDKWRLTGPDDGPSEAGETGGSGTAAA